MAASQTYLTLCHMQNYGCYFLGATNGNAWKEWNQWPLCRTRGNISRERGRLGGKAQYSVKNHPIATIPLEWETPIVDCVPPDVLHLRPRVGEKLVTNLIAASTDHTKDKLTPLFAELVRSCGVPFKISESSIHGQNHVGFNSLNGRHWRQLLPLLPTKIRASCNIFEDSVKEPLAALVEQFVEILAIAGKGDKEDAERLARKTTEWLNSFLNLGQQGLKGFATRDITPYIHWMNAHLPYSLSRFGGLDKLSGELLEAQNDEIKKTHLRRTHFRYRQRLITTFYQHTCPLSNRIHIILHAYLVWHTMASMAPFP